MNYATSKKPSNFYGMKKKTLIFNLNQTGKGQLLLLRTIII